MKALVRNMSQDENQRHVELEQILSLDDVRLNYHPCPFWRYRKKAAHLNIAYNIIMQVVTLQLFIQIVSLTKPI